ncbi:hypothetical protein CMI42_05225 [Candidatus Pacearchaeota archaeon]|nr:hypothetical protein [Candidatus Pacearchaeota archaeon]|tara:strand:- start:78 stop:647 length:570 start_codon:yes stop_codon:yes gene_type:complete
MKIIKHDEIEENDDLMRSAYQNLDPAFRNRLIEEYGAFPKSEYDSEFSIWFGSKLPNLIIPIYQLLKGNISQKRVLDLGCGSHRDTYEAREFDPKKYEPWICRALIELGANPLGVDIGNLEGEMFEHYTLNLLEPNSLGFIQENSIDIAFESLLYDSPTLTNMKGHESLRELLISQLERIVKPGGYFIE